MAAGPAMLQQLTPVLTAVKQGLALARQDVFLSAAALTVVGVVISLMLIDLPLRRSNRRTQSTANADEASSRTIPSFEM